MLLDDLRSATLLRSGTSKAHPIHHSQQRLSTCSAMHPSNGTNHVQDERQTLLSNIDRIRTHGSYPDTFSKDPLAMAFSGMQGALQGARASAQDTLGWLRQALRDPDDFSSAAVGRMVSKAYGKHEPPHTEHHRLRSGSSPRSSPPNSPLASPAFPATQQHHSRPVQDSSQNLSNSKSDASTMTRFEAPAAAQPAGERVGLSRGLGVQDEKQDLPVGGEGVVHGFAAVADDAHVINRDQGDM